jgi:hypothetical protein
MPPAKANWEIAAKAAARIILDFIILKVVLNCGAKVVILFDSSTNVVDISACIAFL